MVKKLLLFAIFIEICAFIYLFTFRHTGQITTHSHKQTQLETLSLPTVLDKDDALSVHSPIQIDEIKQKYRSKMEQLESQTEAQLLQIFEANMQEYKENWSLSLITDVKNQFEQLEADTDQKFNALYSSLEVELEENGYSKEQAEEFKEEYEQKKESYTKSLLNIVVQKLGI